MDFEIYRITIQVMDKSSGRVLERELSPGAPWPCTSEDLEVMMESPTEDKKKASKTAKAVAAETSGKASAATKKAATKRAAKAVAEETSSKASSAKKKAATKKAARAVAEETSSKASSAKKKASKKKASKKATASKKKTAKPLDLSELGAREAYDERVLEVVRGAPSSAPVINAVVGGDRMQTLGALSRLIDKEILIKSGHGRSTRYQLHTEDTEPASSKASSPAPAPEVVPRSRSRVRLRWHDQVIDGRKTVYSRFANGGFRIVAMRSGSNGLYYEGDDDNLLVYGCGSKFDELKSVARKLAVAGLPDPAVYWASNGDIAACPEPKKMRLGDVELTWHETIKDGQQLCVAPTDEGELRVVESDGGSFLLIFARKGDDAFDTLGCGSREELEIRALNLLAEVTEGEASLEEHPADDDARESTTDTAEERAKAPASTGDEALENRLVDSFVRASAQLIMQIGEEA